MQLISWDTETHLIRPGTPAPRMVCLSYQRAGEPSRLVLRDDGLQLIAHWLDSSDTALIGHNVWFDLGVVVTHRPDLLPAVFLKLKAGQIHDTMLRQQLIDVAEGELKFFFDEDTGEIKRTGYGMADLSIRLLRKIVDKKDTWRLRYSELDGVPLPQWPEEASGYALKDAEMTLALFQHQERQIRASTWKAMQLEGTRITYALPNSVEQHRAAWALHLMSLEGVRTDKQAVAKLRQELEADAAEQMRALRPSGLFTITPARVLKSGPRKGQVVPEQISKNMEAIYSRVLQTHPKPVPRTESGRVATDKKTLEATGDPELKALAIAGGTQKLLTTYIPILESGTEHAIHPRYHPLMETGRTSCSKPNLQNPPRKGGVRECFVPRLGHVFGFVDYDTLELRALAQACLDILGQSKMAEALRRGDDLHLALAAEMLGISLPAAADRMRAGDPVIKEYRQQAKPANFGFPGGMAADSFREFAAAQKVFLTEAQCRTIHDAWFRKWSEMRDYFGHIKALPDRIKQLRSNRVRGGASFCAKANGFFQGLAADGAKEALWRVARECYLPGTALYGSKPVLFLHDEIAIETPEGPGAAPACERLAVVMREAMEQWITDVPIRCGPVMLRRWYKGAEAVRINGVLVPSKPHKSEGKTTWVADL